MKKRIIPLVLLLLFVCILNTAGGESGLLPGVLADFTDQASVVIDQAFRSYERCLYDYDHDGTDELFFLVGYSSSEGAWPLGARIHTGPALRDPAWTNPVKIPDTKEIRTVCFIDINPEDGADDLVVSVLARDGSEATILLQGRRKGTDSYAGSQWKDTGGAQVFSGPFRGINLDGILLIGNTKYTLDQDDCLKEVGTAEAGEELFPGYAPVTLWEPAPKQEPVPTARPEPTSEPQPEPEPEPQPDAQTEPPAEPTSEPQPAVTADDSAYIGVWHCVWMNVGSRIGDPRQIYGDDWTISLGADHIGVDSVNPDGPCPWALDESGDFVNFEDQVLSLLDRGFLQFGKVGSGHLIYHQDPKAVWDESIPLNEWLPAYAAAVPEKEPAQAPQGNAVANGIIPLEVKYTCVSYSVSGNQMDASILGAEYSIVFHEGGAAGFTMAGQEIPGLFWSTDGADYIVDYFGQELRFVANEEGLSLDFFGSMVMQLNP